MVFKKITFQNRYVALEILNFHFDYLNPSLSQDSWRGPIEANLLRGTSRIRPERDIEIVQLLGSLPRQIDIDRLSDLSPPPVFI